MLPVLVILGFFNNIAFSRSASRDCGFAEQDEVDFFDVRIPTENVPANGTFYICQQIPILLDLDKSYHMVAFEPLISNKEVVHHMLLFGCSSDGASNQRTHECSGTDSTMCPVWLTVWTLGQTGRTCLHGNTGVRFGKDSTQTLGLQIHWNNAFKRTYLFDNSGFRIYYTTKLRQYDLGHVQIGQDDIEIPAKASQSLVSGSCSASCTRQILAHPIYFTMTSLHMHHLGVRAHFRVYRNDLLVKTIASDDNFQYSSSSLHVHRPEVEILPGDEVRLDCWFSNPGNQSVFWGKGSGAEMCYAFVSYYPEAPGFAQCVQFAQYDTCLPNASDPTQVGPCHASTFYRQSESMFRDILTKCPVKQAKWECSNECSRAISALTRHECMQDRLGKYFRRQVFKASNLWLKVRKIISRYSDHFVCLM